MPWTLLWKWCEKSGTLEGPPNTLLILPFLYKSLLGNRKKVCVISTVIWKVTTPSSQDFPLHTQSFFLLQMRFSFYSQKNIIS